MRIADQPETTQETISAEIVERHRAETEAAAGGSVRTHPFRDFAPYRSAVLRHPTHELVRADPEEIELVSPAFGHTDVAAEEATSRSSTRASRSASASS